MWEPHTVVTHETIDPGPIAALASLFDNGLATPQPGDELPPLWHWVGLARWPVSSAIGTDGHPARGTFLPPIDLPRRMFAGGQVDWHADLRVGETVRRESRAESVTEKSGRSGRLVLAVVRTRLFRESGQLALEERQDLIYRETGEAAAMPETDPAAVLTPIGSPFRPVDESTWEFATDPTLLMRFSAATANAHRIHYDWPYATRIEGYPGLVVHGPLMTLALAEVRRMSRWAGQLTRIRHRNMAPLFCGQSAHLHSRPSPHGFDLEVRDDETAPSPNTRLELELTR
jgi:3-methylfumaryl-CoA hydratase